MKLSKERVDKMWILDESIIKRSFAIMGYNLIATVLIYAGIFLVMAIIGGASLMFE